MKARLAKLDRLAQRIDAEHLSELEDHDRMMSMIATAMYSNLPELRLITEADTTPETYARIRSTLAYARGDCVAGRHWAAKESKTDLPRLPGETSRAWCVRRIAQCGLDARVSSDETSVAIARAQQRLGKA